jgi:D-tyrosyl-tRNA(Tyr) deacylase
MWMQVVVQRVRRAKVSVEGHVVGEIGPGLVALVGVGHGSTDQDAEWLARKTAELRVFTDADGRMNRSVADAGGGVLAISQFTLYGDATKGRRPSFVRAAEPGAARARYERYCQELERLGLPTVRGVFGAHMVIDLSADGPVTLRLVREAGVTAE